MTQNITSDSGKAPSCKTALLNLYSLLAASTAAGKTSSETNLTLPAITDAV